MAYRRRYLSGQSATTVTIAEGAITTDKIVDKAVTQPKVDDNAITSDKIADETIQSEDIKAGEVKTSDLGNGAVTTEKIADQAVTVDKLEASIQGIARPLTPGVSSAEIAAGAVVASKIGAQAVETAKIKDTNVTAAKLAADAVETVKVKDGAITTAKIAGGAIDQTKIGANAVTGSEIQDGAVSTSELATDSVETSKVIDGHITLAKLAPNSVDSSKIVAEGVGTSDLNVAAIAQRHRESFLVRTKNFAEEFGGVDITNRWAKTGDPGGLVYPDSLFGIAIEAAAGVGDAQRIDWGGKQPIRVTSFKPLLTFLISGRTAALNQLTNICGLWKDVNNQIVFYAHDAAGATPNWFAKCVEAGAPTTIDTGIAIDTSGQLLSIEYLSDIAVKFYIDGVLKATVVTNIPSLSFMEPRFEIITQNAGARMFRLQDMILLGVKSV